MNSFFRSAPPGSNRRVRLLLAMFLAIVLCNTTARAWAVEFQNFQLWQTGNFRGFNLGSTRTADLEAFQSINANIGRVFVMLSRPAGSNAYTMPSDTYTQMDRLVGLARQYNFKIVVTFNPLPKAPDSTYWFNTEQQNSLVWILTNFAKRYAGDDAFAGFDLLNEPYPVTTGHTNVPPGFDGLTAWETLASRMVRAIREQDPTRVLIYEFPYHSAMYTVMRPLPFDGIVYSTHFYTPHALTHQGIGGRPMGVNYPSTADSSIGLWNWYVLLDKLAPVRAFQLAYRVPVYIGEFSCNRQAPDRSSYRYSAQLATISDQYGWSWTYMNFRGGNTMWDAERAYGLASDPRSLDTDLMKFLRELLAKNP